MRHSAWSALIAAAIFAGPVTSRAADYRPLILAPIPARPVPHTLSVCELIKARGYYDDEMVTVRGGIAGKRLGSEGLNLLDHRCSKSVIRFGPDWLRKSNKESRQFDDFLSHNDRHIFWATFKGRFLQKHVPGTEDYDVLLVKSGFDYKLEPGEPLVPAPPPAKRLPVPIPIEQSRCEIAVNKFATQHPHADALFLMKHIPFLFGPASPPKLPFYYRDDRSGIMVRVEKDGRHIDGTDGKGKRLWRRDPFVENNICPYRSAHPYIYTVNSGASDTPGKDGKPVFPDERVQYWARDFFVRGIAAGMKLEQPAKSDRFVWLQFNSSQFGYINLRNGDFFFEGQN